MPEVAIPPFEHLVEFVCITCGQLSSRTLPTGQWVQYCSDPCRKRAHRTRKNAGRLARDGDPQLGQPGFPGPPRWLLAVRVRMDGGSVVQKRPRCEVTGKVTYVSMAEAWVTALTDFAGIPTLNAYFCKRCKGYHLGNKKVWAIRGVRRRAQLGIERAQRQLLLGYSTHGEVERRSDDAGAVAS